MKIIEDKLLNLRDKFQYERKIPLMLTMMNFGFIFKLFLFEFCHINEPNCYVIFLLGLPYPQKNTVVTAERDKNKG